MVRHYQVDVKRFWLAVGSRKSTLHFEGEEYALPLSGQDVIENPESSADQAKDGSCERQNRRKRVLDVRLVKHISVGMVVEANHLPKSHFISL